MDKVRKNLEKAGLAGKNKLSVVPKPYINLCTKRVLVMEELKGEKLPEALKRDFERYAENAGMTVEQFKTQEEAKLRDIKRKGGNVNGPSSQEYAIYIKLVEAKRRAENTSAMIHNFTIGWLPGVQKKPYKGKNILPMNHAKLIDDLIYIHGHEVLVDGYFNGDPVSPSLFLRRRYSSICSFLTHYIRNFNAAPRKRSDAGSRRRKASARAHRLWAGKEFDQGGETSYV